MVEFAADEHPRATTSIEKVAVLPPLRPEIAGFSITAGNACGGNDAAAALALVADDLARDDGLEALATVRAWASAGVQPRLTGVGAIDAAVKVLDRAGLTKDDVHLWEINEAFASVRWRCARCSASTRTSSTSTAAASASATPSPRPGPGC